MQNKNCLFRDTALKNENLLRRLPSVTKPNCQPVCCLPHPFISCRRSAHPPVRPPALSVSPSVWLPQFGGKGSGGGWRWAAPAGLCQVQENARVGGRGMGSGGTGLRCGGRHLSRYVDVRFHDWQQQHPTTLAPPPWALPRACWAAGRSPAQGPRSGRPWR